MHLRIGLVALSLGAMLAACHSEMENVPLTEQKVYFSDKFYDVKSLSAERALIIGYGGKILETTDGGASFNKIDSGTDLALYKIFALGNNLWIAGQEGLGLHSGDGGQTWHNENHNTTLYPLSVL